MSRLGVVDPPWSYLVVGKVHLFDVLPYRPPPTMKISPRAEYRARVGGIVELGLLDTDGGPEAVAFGQELRDRYDVEVLDISVRGELGDFAQASAGEHTTDGVGIGRSFLESSEETLVATCARTRPEYLT